MKVQPDSFNSRPHKEVDFCPYPFWIKEETFQFTTSQGGRQESIRSEFRRWIFQFTTSQGGRRTVIFAVRPVSSFQFTTSQGGRREDVARAVRGKDFQFTTSQGGRHPAYNPEGIQYAFQFTTSQGGRRVSLCELVHIWSTFNSRPHKEVDSFFELIYFTIIPFNSRPHKEVDLKRWSQRTGKFNLSIHDLTRRSTEIDFGTVNVTHFQFTTSQGGRLRLTENNTL